MIASTSLEERTSKDILGLEEDSDRSYRLRKLAQPKQQGKNCNLSL